MAQYSFDRRRNNGPEGSQPPIFDDHIISKSEFKKRKDRAALDIRPIFLQPGLISQATGSAYIETERAKVACAIYGPRQSKNTSFYEKGRLNVEVKFAPYSCQSRRSPMHDAEDRSIGMAIHQALISSVRLETFPKATIDIFVTIIETDGIESCVSAGSIAASTALAYAGIEVIGLVMSCSAAAMGSEIWLDPTDEESCLSDGSLVLSCMPALSSVTSVWQKGRMGPSQALACVEACQTKCNDIHAVVAQALVEGSIKLHRCNLGAVYKGVTLADWSNILFDLLCFCPSQVQ